MNLRIIIEKLDGDIDFPISEYNESLKFTHSGIEMNGKLHFWDDILHVSITNREKLNELRKDNKCH